MQKTIHSVCDTEARCVNGRKAARNEGYAASPTSLARHGEQHPLCLAVRRIGGARERGAALHLDSKKRVIVLTTKQPHLYGKTESTAWHFWIEFCIIGDEYDNTIRLQNKKAWNLEYPPALVFDHVTDLSQSAFGLKMAAREQSYGNNC